MLIFTDTLISSKTDWDKLREASMPKPARSLKTFQDNTGNDMEASSRKFRVALP